MQHRLNQYHNEQAETRKEIQKNENLRAFAKEMRSKAKYRLMTFEEEMPEEPFTNFFL